MSDIVLGSIIGVSGAILGTIVSHLFEIIRSRKNAELQRQNEFFRFFFKKRAKSYERLFTLYAHTNREARDAILKEGDPIKAFHLFQAITKFAEENPFLSDDVFNIVMEMREKALFAGEDPLKIVRAHYKVYGKLRKRIRVELGELLVPEPSPGKAAPKKSFKSRLRVWKNRT